MPEFVYVGYWTFQSDENLKWNELGVTDAYPAQRDAVNGLVSYTKETISEIADHYGYDEKWINNFFAELRDVLNEDEDFGVHCDNIEDTYCVFKVLRIKYFPNAR